jgi:Tol biopolymer transport system component
MLRAARRSRPLHIALALALVALVAGLLVARGPLAGLFSSRQSLPTSGQLALPADTGLIVLNLDDGQERIVVPAPPGELITSADWSPDGRQIAYGLFHRRPGDPTSVSEIYLVGADGSSPHVVGERDRPGAVLDTPVWTPDGQEVLFSYFGQVSGKVVQRVDAIRPETGERRTVVDDGYGPDVSPDGKSVLFLRDERAGMGLWSTALTGGEARPIIAPGRYPALAVPRFAPDGTRVAVAIINTGTAERPTTPFDWLLPPPVFAHGNPWDIWTFDTSGGDPLRLSYVNADDPSPTWSPDGRYLAFWSGGGLYLVGAAGGDLRKVRELGGYGPLDWER